MAAQALLLEGVLATQDLRDAASEAEAQERIQGEWLKVPGQRSGITWHYVRMLAGVPGVKPDRMIIRFVAQALDLPARQVSPEFAREAVTGAAREMGVSPTDLDHGIWQWQRRKRKQH